MKEKENKKIDYKWIIILLLIALLLAVLLIKFDGVIQKEPVETLIEAVNQDDTEYIPVDANQVRIRINTNLKIENGRVRDLEFVNLNEGKTMELSILVDDKVIYESSRIKTGESITDAKVDVTDLQPGKNKGLAEVRYYLEDGTYDGETHFNISINY